MGSLISFCCECACCVGCSCFTWLFDATLSQATRFGHLSIVLAVYTLAIVLGVSYPDKVVGIVSTDLESDCSSSYENECIYRQLIYRASFALVVLYSILAVFSACTEYFDKNFWTGKYIIAFGLFIGFWWGTNSFFSGWAEAARVISFFWLIVQALLFLDVAHDTHDVIMEKADEEDRTGGDSRPWYALYLLLAASCLTAVGVGLAYLFRDFTGCSTGLAFVLIALFMGVILTGVSMLNVVNKGLLTPCIMFAYSIFVVWYALLNCPDESCNPTADLNWGTLKVLAAVIIACVTVVVLMYCVVSGTKILNLFNPEGDGTLRYATGLGSNSSNERQLRANLTGDDDENNGKEKTNGKPDAVVTEPTAVGSTPTSKDVESQSSGTMHERVFFHVLMILFSSYTAMIATFWGKTNGEPDGIGSSTTGDESMWLIIASEWVFLLLYCKVLHAAYLDRQENL